MKKINLLKNCSYLFFIALLGSCSSGHYAHLNKIQRDGAITNEQAVKQILDQKNSEVTATAGPVEKPMETEICKDGKTTPATLKEKIGGAHKSKNNFLSNVLASKIIKNIPNKINSVFSEKKNIANHTNKSERSNLLYIIVVALLVLFLLGLLGGGGALGSLIYIVLVIAVVLLLLRLLGIA
jgi:preprotein translocase subunit Sss1